MGIKRSNVLAGDYYLINFHEMVAFVIKTYADLLHSDEKAWYENISQISVPAQRLYIRLLTRQGSTFRLGRLKYPEICELLDAATELSRANLAITQPPQDWITLMAGFRKSELIELFDLKSCKKLPRARLLERLKNSDSIPVESQCQILQEADRWITLRGHQYFTLMQLCFFGTLYQNISEFVLRDLGTLRYESYPLSPAARPFRSREQIDAHMQFYECVALYEHIDQYNPSELLELVKSLPVCPADDINLRRRSDRLRNTIARQMERLSENSTALTLYEHSIHPPARERRVRLLLAQSRLGEADAICQLMLSNPYNEAERLAATRLHRQWRKASNLPCRRERRFRPQSSRLVLLKSTDRVEIAACRFFARRGECHYVENSLFNGVLGLLIWDVVFQAVPGVFFNPFQSAPSDFHQPAFIRDRADLLKERMGMLDDRLQFTSYIHSVFKRSYGIVNPLVRWQSLNKALLARAMEHIPVEHWRAIFMRQLLDLRDNTTGFPDLVFFPKEGGYELIEIKGPGDILQANQRCWMQYFQKHGVPCRVVNIRWSNVDAFQKSTDEEV